MSTSKAATEPEIKRAPLLEVWKAWAEGLGDLLLCCTLALAPGFWVEGWLEQRVRVCLRCQQATATVSLSLGGRGLAAAQCQESKRAGLQF